MLFMHVFLFSSIQTIDLFFFLHNFKTLYVFSEASQLFSVTSVTHILLQGSLSHSPPPDDVPEVPLKPVKGM